jgi:hypothetical protein
VLHHLDANPVELQRRPPRLIDPQSGVGRNPRGAANVVTHERDPSVLGRRPKLNANVPSAEVTKTGYRYGPTQRALATRN